MSTRLQPLRTRLNDLRRKRWAARVSIGLAGLAVAVLWSLAILFVADWLLEMNRLPRLVLIATAVGTVAFAFVRLTKPWLMSRESLIDMALLVERQQKLDNDLVAALQFETSDAVRWGSPQLQTAVVDYVAEFSHELDVFTGISFAPLRSRLSALGLTLAVAGLAFVLYPSHAAVFWNRLLLGGAHYPTQTRVDRIVINGQTVFPASLVGSDGNVPPIVRVPYGRSLRVEVACAGQLPTGGLVKLTNSLSGLATTFDLKPAVEPDGIFNGELSRLTDAVSYQIFIGDAWTDPARIDLVPLPVVNLELIPTPPDYAVGAAGQIKPQSSSRQLSVLEGSRLDVRLTCVNKSLREATIAVQHGPTISLVSTGNDRKVWTLDPSSPAASSSRAANDADQQTPFARVTSLLAFEVQVTDDDGLQLERPLVAVVRIQEDRPPKIAGAVVTDRVLPAARPSITVGATDDFGVAAIRLLCDVHHGMAEPVRHTIDVVKQPAEPQLVLRGRHPLDLRPLGLTKGDEVHITLEAIDFRGGNAGQSARSEPIVLRVTDESGVLAGLTEADERSARQLDAIIQRQLGIGEAK
ncbi:MAG: hypothetical protein HZA46_19400 [Planctomycetales bacterium]|nr:hypothetical protein [Planctomycetales bacterium]